jgi:hypothetical protein
VGRVERRERVVLRGLWVTPVALPVVVVVLTGSWVVLVVLADRVVVLVRERERRISRPVGRWPSLSMSLSLSLPEEAPSSVVWSFS